MIVKHMTVYPFQLRSSTMLCLFCRERYDNLADFRSHMKTQHEPFEMKKAFHHVSKTNYIKVDCTEISCRLCFKKISTPNEIPKHLEEEHAIKFISDAGIAWFPYRFVNDKLVCGICDVNKPGLRQLSIHIATHYKNYTCDACGKSYMVKSSLLSHYSLRHAEEKFPCTRCRKTFSTNHARKEHIVASKPCWQYMCKICKIRFLTYRLKVNHHIDVHGATKKTYPCTECSKVFEKPTHYRKHFKFTHSTTGFDACPHCWKRFDCKRDLEDHVLCHTKGGLDLKCPTCFKTFARTKSLRRHMLTHIGFQCSVCGKKYKQKSFYRNHMKNHQ